MKNIANCISHNLKKLVQKCTIPLLGGFSPIQAIFKDSFFENLRIHQNFTTFRKFSMRFNLSASGKKVCVWLRPQGLRVPLSIDKKHAQPEKAIKIRKTDFPDYALPPADLSLLGGTSAFRIFLYTTHFLAITTIFSYQLLTEHKLTHDKLKIEQFYKIV